MHFFEYGKLDGVPLVFMLGTPHTGDSVAELSDLATETGVRLICTTRPWYVDTATVPSFGICTAEVIRYLNAQGINRAFVIGGSGGDRSRFILRAPIPMSFAVVICSPPWATRTFS